ncbi:hypothetical protein NPIL_207921, partial [Nephila pilipes]
GSDIEVFDIMLTFEQVSKRAVTCLKFPLSSMSISCHHIIDPLVAGARLSRSSNKSSGTDEEMSRFLNSLPCADKGRNLSLNNLPVARLITSGRIPSSVLMSIGRRYLIARL